jgi:hypothetical protein
MINSKVHDGTDITTSKLGTDNKMETMCIDAMQNDNAANINTNTDNYCLPLVLSFTKDCCRYLYHPA